MRMRNIQVQQISYRIQRAILKHDSNYLKNIYYYNRPIFQQACFTSNLTNFIKSKIHNMDSNDVSAEEILMWNTLIQIHIDGGGALHCLQDLPNDVKTRIKKLDTTLYTLQHFTPFWKDCNNLMLLIGTGVIITATLCCTILNFGAKDFDLIDIKDYLTIFTLLFSISSLVLLIVTPIDEVIANISDCIKGPYSLAHIVRQEDYPIRILDVT